MYRDYLIKYIDEVYGVSPEYPWESAPAFAVFRHRSNKKWFAVIMDISAKKLGMESDAKIDVMNIKTDPILLGSLLHESGFYPAYHMSKTNWVTVVLGKNADVDKIKWLLGLSHELTASKKGKRKEG